MHRESSLKARQIKAARALLDWSQEDLAKAADLSIATIRKLETGHISPRGKTQQLIRRAFEDSGLEFLEPDGVRHRPDEIAVYQDADGFRNFYDDIYQTMKRKGGEIVVVCPSETQFIDALGDYMQIHTPRMIAIRHEVSVKCLITENDEILPASKYCQYRWLSKNYVDSVPFYIYGDKYAAITFDANPSPKVVVIQSPIMAAAFRKQFYSMWDKATPLNTLIENSVKNKKQAKSR